MKTDFNLEKELQELEVKHQKQVRALKLTDKVYKLCGVKPICYTHYERDAVGFEFRNKYPFNTGEKRSLKKVFSFLLEHFPIDLSQPNYEYGFAGKESIPCDGCWKIDISSHGNDLTYESKDFKLIVRLPEELAETYRVEYNTHKKQSDVFLQPFLPKDLVQEFTSKYQIYSNHTAHEKRFVYSGTNEKLIKLMEHYANSEES